MALCLTQLVRVCVYRHFSKPLQHVNVLINLVDQDQIHVRGYEIIKQCLYR